MISQWYCCRTSQDGFSLAEWRHARIDTTIRFHSLLFLDCSLSILSVFCIVPHCLLSLSLSRLLSVSILSISSEHKTHENILHNVFRIYSQLDVFCCFSVWFLAQPHLLLCSSFPSAYGIMMAITALWSTPNAPNAKQIPDTPVNYRHSMHINVFSHGFLFLFLHKNQ